MAQKLFAIANSTDSDATYSSTEYDWDACEVPKLAVTHTGGKDDNFVYIADCSDSNYFDAHHCTIAAKDGSWIVSIWNDDNDGHLFYWSADEFYTKAHPVQSSNEWVNVALLITPGPHVHCAEWT
jgi:hypothetical protein